MLAAAALAMDPERLLWTPGKQTIFIPPVRYGYDLGHGDYTAYMFMAAGEWVAFVRRDATFWFQVQRNELPTARHLRAARILAARRQS
ncbi:MAG: hypothetical protein PHC88_05590 [Terrimicrobiaceae bacterium]|nr:hypothetical protein [Terrimicrobiaceae bacterium]